MFMLHTVHVPDTSADCSLRYQPGSRCPSTASVVHFHSQHRQIADALWGMHFFCRHMRMCTNLQVGEKRLSSLNLWSALGRLQIYWQVESSTYYLHLQGLTASISSRKCLMWDRLLSLILHCQESCARMAWRSSVQRGVCAETLSRCPWRSRRAHSTTRLPVDILPMLK